MMDLFKVVTLQELFIQLFLALQISELFNLRLCHEKKLQYK